VVCKLGGTVDDSTMIAGAVFDHKASKAAGGPTRVQDAKIGLVQFCISPPKTDIENNVIISDYQQMDRFLPLRSPTPSPRHPRPPVPWGRPAPPAAPPPPIPFPPLSPPDLTTKTIPRPVSSQKPGVDS